MVRGSLEIKHRHALLNHDRSRRQGIEDSLQVTLFLDTHFLRSAIRVWEGAGGQEGLGKGFKKRAVLRYVSAVVKFESLLRGVSFLLPLVSYLH